MTTESIAIRRYARRSSAAVATLAFLRGMLRAIPSLVAGLLVLSCLDAALQIPVWGRRIVWLLGAGTALGLFASGFFPFTLFSLKQRSRNLMARSRDKHPEEGLRPDDLEIAVEFSGATETVGTSAELRERFVLSMAGKLARLPAAWCFPVWKWRKALLIAFVPLMLHSALQKVWPDVFGLSPRILFPFAAFEIQEALSISPGDADVPWGKDVLINVALKQKSFYRPAVLVKSAQGWIPLKSEGETLNSWSFRAENVVEPLSYRVEWKGEWSRRYLLTPVEPSRIKRFSISLEPPAYTGQPVQTQSHPEIRGLSGSLVRMEIEASEDLGEARIVFAGVEKPADSLDGRKARFSFSLDQSHPYSFSLKNKVGRDLALVDSYPIHVLPDNPPTIQLLSPDEDLIVGPREKIPLTFDARDDFGVSEVTLIYDSAQGKKGRLSMSRYGSSRQSLLETYSWDLSALSFSPRDVVRYSVEARDGNVVTGPGITASGWRAIEIKSFEEDHQSLEKELEIWRDKAVELLAQVNTIKAKSEREGAEMAPLEADFKPAAQDSQALEKFLKNIVNRMEADPLVDYGVWMEHTAMSDNMKAMNEGAVKNAQASFQTQNKQALESNLETMSGELERMVALSENLSKAQKARDMLQSSEKLAELGEDLNKKLEKGEKDPAMMAQIRDLVAEARKNLMEMAQAFKDMPQELPEDFVNQEALKDLKVGETSDVLSQIEDAIKKGDLNGALAKAKEFLKMAQQMKKQLSEAHESFVESNSAENLEQEMDKHGKELNEIVDSQRGLLAETQKLESKRLESVMKSQQDLLSKLAKLQEELINKLSRLNGEKDLASNAAIILAVQVPVMTNISQEFHRGRLDQSIPWLDSVIGQLSVAEQFQSQAINAPAALKEKISEIKTGEQNILSELKKTPPNAPAGAGEESEFRDLEKRQTALGQRTSSLRRDLQGLARKTANVGLPITQSLSKAGGEMEKASKSLDQSASREAQSSEERALQNLMEGQQMLDQAQKTLGEMAQQEGGGSGGPKVVLRTMNGGGRGTQTGKVRLPRAEDYKPPREFREDLLESLKENYPKIYEDIIQKYFKRLSE